MTQLIQLPSALEDVPPEEHGRWCCARLEEGDILFFAKTPFELPQDEVRFLLGQKQSDAGYHKNIAYRPTSDRLTGYAQASSSDKERLHAIMRQYSQKVIGFTRQLLSPYGGWGRRTLPAFGRSRRQAAKSAYARVTTSCMWTHFQPGPPMAIESCGCLATSTQPSLGCG